MALVLKDRVRETSTTSGTGTIVLAGAVSGFQSFSAIGNTNTTYYCIADSTTGGWEVGIGTYTSSGTTLSRTTVLASSNSGALVAFSANVKDVFCTYPASQSANVNAALTSGRVTYATTDGLLTDSAGLTFDGTNFATTGTATATKLIPTGTSVTGNGMYLPATNSVGISTAGTNAVYIDASQNVGIGTSSPISKFQVKAATNQNLYIGGSATIANSVVIGGINDAASANIPLEFRYGTTAAFINSGTEAMRLDSSGNVGIGTSSPTNKLDVTAALGAVNVSSSTGTNYVKLQVNNTGGSFQFAIENSAGSNFGAPAYSRVLWNDGAYPTVFFTNSTQRMQIDSSGNVGIGTSSPGSKLSINTAALYGGGTTNENTVIIGGTPPSADTTRGMVGIYDQTALAAGVGGSLTFGGYYVGTSTTFFAGIKGSKTNATSGSFTGDLLLTSRNGNTIFYGSMYATEQMRIDTSGNVLIGTTSGASERFTVYNTSTSQVTAIVKNNVTSGLTADIFQVQTAQAAGTGYYLSRWYSGGTQQFGVRGDGLVFSVALNGGATTLSTDAYGNIIRTISDAALKTNVQPIQYGLDTVMKLKPIKHNWVKHINMGDSSIGFIAQDMELEVPEIVNGAEYKSIDYPKLTAVLAKAIQEQQALIESLTTRLTALEQK